MQQLLSLLVGFLVTLVVVQTAVAVESCGGQEKLFTYYAGASLVSDPDGVYGYKDAEGNIRITPRFTGMSFDFWDNGFAYADGAYINLEGERVYDFYQNDNGPDYFYEGLVRYTENGKVGFLNACMQVVIPAQFTFASQFRGGHSQICEGCRYEPVYPGAEHGEYVGGKRAFINRKGEIVKIAEGAVLSEIIKEVYGFQTHKVVGDAVGPESSVRYDIEFSKKPTLSGDGICRRESWISVIDKQSKTLSLRRDRTATSYALAVQGNCEAIESWTEVSTHSDLGAGTIKIFLEMLNGWQKKLVAHGSCESLLGEDICRFYYPFASAERKGVYFSFLKFKLEDKSPDKQTAFVMATLQLHGCAIDIYFRRYPHGASDILKADRACMYR